MGFQKQASRMFSLELEIGFFAPRKITACYPGDRYPGRVWSSKKETVRLLWWEKE
jgi:hypothetical protein